MKRAVLLVALAALLMPVAPSTGASFRPCRNATIVGTLGPNFLVGTSRRDVIRGRAGNDVILGLGGTDTICGNTGNDRLVGGIGTDFIYGGFGRFDDCDGEHEQDC